MGLGARRRNLVNLLGRGMKNYEARATRQVHSAARLTHFAAGPIADSRGSAHRLTVNADFLRTPAQCAESPDIGTEIAA
jgi:hypothetical protein